ncbi:MAG: hypothetical protein Q8S94_05260 [Pseudohongiella sp.]|nr:hypothetical protein [Pseudohongiella sp.]
MGLSLLRIFLLLMMLSPAVAQQADEQVKDEELAQDESMVDEARAAEVQLLRESANNLQARLAELADQAGFYDVSLAEVQLDLGRVYLELEEFTLAEDMLTQALQLLRINSGLYDARQIDVLEQLVNAYKFQSDWKKVDDYQHLVFSLQQRHFKPESPEYADAALNMGEWRILASRANITGRTGTYQSVQALEEIKDIYTQAIVHAQDRGDVPRLWQLTYAGALLDVEMARHLLNTDMNDMMIAAPRYLTQTVCRTVAGANGTTQRVCWQETVNNPDYYSQLNNQRRTQLERARLNLQRAERELNELLAANPAFASEQADQTMENLQVLSKVSDELMRESRRTTFQAW